MSGRAKWNAWKKAGQEYPDENGKERAIQRYLEMAKQLGWQEQSVGSETKQASTDIDYDRLDEDDGADESKQSDSGFNVKVSVMDRPDEVPAASGTLHALVLDGRLDAIEAALQNGDLDVNSRDEFVGLVFSVPTYVEASRGIPRCISLQTAVRQKQCASCSKQVRT
jgi:hypothetical protein